MGTNKIIYLDKEFSATDVTSGNLYQARSLIAASQEIDTFGFDIDSDDTTLTDFIRNTPLTFFHDDEQMGIFYVQKISRTSINTYHFACTSTVGLLDETYHDGGIYTGETVKEVCEDICYPLTVYVKTNLQKIKLYGWLPIATRRENLTQVLFAIGATFKVDFDGAIRIEGLWSGEASEIDAGEIYASGTVDYATPVTEVIVTEHAYSQSATETTELFKGTTSAGDKITFDEPCYDLAASGFSILASGANWATVSAGSGVLMGKKYTHVTRQVIQQIKPKTRELVTQSDNTVKVESATLVSLVNATAVAERLAEYYSHNERINYKIATKREIPGDVVKIAHPYGGTVSGCIESADITVSGKLAAEESVLIDYFPPDIGVQEYYDTVEVLTKDGTWTVPENVTSIRVVLIGGGCGGDPGNKGGECTEYAGNYSLTHTSLTDYTEYQEGYGLYYGGEGGDGGQGGQGGKIMQAALDVSGGDVFNVTIGKGGTGKVFGANDDSHNGGATTFGTFTSADGSPNPYGYVDTINGTVYGGTGGQGLKGGKGGGATRDADWPQITYSPGDSFGDNQPGANGEESTEYGSFLVHDSSTEHEKVWAVGIGEAGGGAGGGAAYGANGGDGSNGSAYARGSKSSIYARAYAGKGGTGATALPPAAQTQIGYGGIGGNGGGGAGSAGYAIGSRRVPKKYAYSGTWDVSGIDNKSKNGEGGNGSSGGDGAPGCVLIYYRVYKASSAGRFVTRDGKGFNEKFTRKVVV